MADPLPRSASSSDYHPPWSKVYDQLDLAGAHLPIDVIRGTEGRAAMRRTVAEWGFPQCSITHATAGFGSCYVIQVGGNRDAGTVTLLGTNGPVVVRLGDPGRRHILPPARTETLLRAVAGEYPPTSVTAALADALTKVVNLCAYHRANSSTDIPAREIEAALAAPLRAYLEAWDTDSDPTTPATTPKAHVQ